MGLNGRDVWENLKISTTEFRPYNMYKTIEEYESYLENKSIDELIDISTHIDKDQYPDRYSLILKYLENGKKNLPKEESSKSSDLSVLTIINHALDYIWGNQASIFETLKYPGLGILLASFCQNPSITSDGGIFNWLFFICETYFYTLFAVQCHRLVLLSESTQTLRQSLRWSNRETYFLLYTLGISFIGMLLCFLPAIFLLALFTQLFFVDRGFGVILFLFFCLPGGYIFSRLSLAFPSIAIDQVDCLHSAWKISEGNGWKIFILVAMTPMVFSEFLKLIESGGILLNGFLSVLGLIIFLFAVTILSLTFNELTCSNIENT